MAGQVIINERIAEKSSQLVKDGDNISLKEKLPFVSRGGYKLDKAIHTFDLKVDDLTLLDIGASTGGFTDCLLQNGARHVYAVDVGYGQLHWSLRQDNRVSVMERTNARHLTPDDLDCLCDGAVCDASFISLTKLLPAIDACTHDEAFFMGLIKPQFEVGKGQVGKGGVVRDPAKHIQVIEDIIHFVNEHTRFSVQNVSFSPITGPKGNMEFLLLCRKSVESKDLDVTAIVHQAHQNFAK